MENKNHDKNQDIVKISQMINKMQHQFLKDQIERQQMEYNTLVFLGALNIIFFVAGLMYFTVFR